MSDAHRSVVFLFFWSRQQNAHQVYQLPAALNEFGVSRGAETLSNLQSEPGSLKFTNMFSVGKSQPAAANNLIRKSLGDDLLSRAVTSQVPSALAGLTSGFGMGPGVPPPHKSPRENSQDIVSEQNDL